MSHCGGRFLVVGTNPDIFLDRSVELSGVENHTERYSVTGGYKGINEPDHGTVAVSRDSVDSNGIIAVVDQVVIMVNLEIDSYAAEINEIFGESQVR